MLGVFETERLAARPLTLDDSNLIADLNSDPGVMKFITGRASSVEESDEELHGAIGGRWLVFDRPSSEFLGWVSASPTDNDGEFEMGWRLRREVWGHGYATEASSALLQRVFVEGARRAFAETMAVNAASRAVMQRIGLRYVRTFHLEFEDPLPGTELGEVEYALTRTEWEQL
jgi:RimJ/RimL family protein N-acetyltransferase